MLAKFRRADSLDVSASSIILARRAEFLWGNLATESLATYSDPPKLSKLSQRPSCTLRCVGRDAVQAGAVERNLRRELAREFTEILVRP